MYVVVVYIEAKYLLRESASRLLEQIVEECVAFPLNLLTVFHMALLPRLLFFNVV